MLQKIRAETGQLKQSLGQRGSDTVMLYTTLVHALPILVERVSDRAAPMHSNLLVSNPFGLEGQRWLMGAAVELALPVSVVAAGHKLNVTAVSLGERLHGLVERNGDGRWQLARTARSTIPAKRIHDYAQLVGTTQLFPDTSLRYLLAQLETLESRRVR